MFKKVMGSITVVDQLWRALQEGRLLDEAGQILPKAVPTKPGKEGKHPGQAQTGLLVLYQETTKQQPLTLASLREKQPSTPK